MNAMIERVARAMYNSNPHVGYWAEWEFLASDDPTKETYIRGAKAAIEAMREPTEAMIKSVQRTNASGEILEAWIFKTMIDELLK